MKKLFLLAAALLTLVACEKPSQSDVPATVNKVTVNPSTCEVLIGESITLEAIVDAQESNYKVEWISTNEDIATVNNGTVTGVASGTAIIMAQVGNKTGNCTVNVVGTPVEQVLINEVEIYMEEGDVRTLRATVLPESADNKSVTWSSSNDSIASVNGSGTVTANKPGDCVIYA